MTAMIIRSKLQRILSNGIKGSNIDMGDGTTIAFREDDNGDHVAMVSNPKHIQRLLSITEGYEIHRMPAQPQDTMASQAAMMDVGAPPRPETAAPPSPPAPTQTVPPAPVQAAQAPAEPQAEPPAVVGDLAALNEEEIRAVFERELKRKPHHNAKRETMVAQIEAMRAEVATSK